MKRFPAAGVDWIVDCIIDSSPPAGSRPDGGRALMPRSIRRGTESTPPYRPLAGLGQICVAVLQTRHCDLAPAFLHPALTGRL
jgi:hypothetical protein